MAENPTSSRTMNRTFGAPSGAFGGSNGDQSGVESRMSVLMTPPNGLADMATISSRPAGAQGPAAGCGLVGPYRAGWRPGPTPSSSDPSEVAISARGDR